MENHTIKAILVVNGLIGSFLLNEQIYRRKWFIGFVPISFLIITTGILIKEITPEYYDVLIAVPIFIYMIKLTQLTMGFFFGMRYTVHIRGIDFRKDKHGDLNDMPTMSTLFSFGLMAFYGLLYVLI